MRVTLSRHTCRREHNQAYIPIHIPSHHITIISQHKQSHSPTTMDIDTASSPTQQYQTPPPLPQNPSSYNSNDSDKYIHRDERKEEDDMIDATTTVTAGNKIIDTTMASTHRNDN